MNFLATAQGRPAQNSSAMHADKENLAAFWAYMKKSQAGKHGRGRAVWAWRGTDDDGMVCLGQKFFFNYSGGER